MPPPSHVVALIRTTPSCTFLLQGRERPRCRCGRARNVLVATALVGGAAGRGVGALLCTTSSPVGDPPCADGAGLLRRRTAAPPTPAAATAMTARAETAGTAHAGRRRGSGWDAGGSCNGSAAVGSVSRLRRQSRTARLPRSGCHSSSSTPVGALPPPTPGRLPRLPPLDPPLRSLPAWIPDATGRPGRDRPEPHTASQEKQGPGPVFDRLTAGQPDEGLHRHGDRSAAPDLGRLRLRGDLGHRFRAPACRELRADPLERLPDVVEGTLRRLRRGIDVTEEQQLALALTHVGAPRAAAASSRSRAGRSSAAGPSAARHRPETWSSQRTGPSASHSLGSESSARSMPWWSTSFIE